jgi:hypothetical protein
MYLLFNYLEVLIQSTQCIYMFEVIITIKILFIFLNGINRMGFVLRMLRFL